MRILVIEDEKGIADGIRAILVKAGYEVDVNIDFVSGFNKNRPDSVRDSFFIFND